MSASQHYVFCAFNTADLIHVLLAAPGTKGFTLEETDDVFNSGLPAWEGHD